MMNRFVRKTGIALAVLCALLMASGCSRRRPAEAGLPANYVGSSSCRECHERFYQLWAPSHHGKAMQPVTPEFAGVFLLPQTEPIRIGENRYLARVDRLDILEMTPSATNTYPMVHAMGGKNVYFFLTPLDRGRLQVMPISFNVETQCWYDTTASMVRHFGEVEDEAIDWQDPLLTFNAACFGCHVSQMSKNYDAKTDSYRTEWREPGINCEACHGPCEEHVRVCRAAPAGTVPADLKTIIWRDFTVQQKSDACAPCHAKMRPLTAAFMPGDRFFDHYDLVCLEDRDFYPDGRDLGENYTQTLWLMSPCVRSGMLDCVHCHTSSGRYRFAEENPNGACLPCHAERVANARAHTHHAPPPEGPKCIDCHMPMTAFAQMRRSDHSMRPPAPEATLAFGSPNACGLCHADKETEVLAAKVREWHPQAKWTERILREGRLFDEARHNKWERLDEMLAFMQDPAADPVQVCSYIRVLIACQDGRKLPVIKQCLKHASPLVRAAAADALRDALDLPTVLLLADALCDDYRVVRVRAAGALTRWPRENLTDAQRQALERAEQEMFITFDALPDHWSSHYNRGNYFGDRDRPEEALAAYERAIRQRGDVLQPYVNAAVTASRLGRLDDSLRFLREAHRLAPEDAGVNFNLGLALAEKGDAQGAEKHLRAALKDAGTKGPAAYNLAVLVGAEDAERAVRLCRMATEAQPDNPRYAYTLAYYLKETGDTDATVIALEALVGAHAGYGDAWVMLAETCQAAGRMEQAVATLERMRTTEALPSEARAYARRRLETLRGAPGR